MNESAPKKYNKKKEVSLSDLQLKVPPQNADAERALLGAIMLHPDAFHKVSSLITPEDFYLQSHRWIFEVLLKQEVDNKPLDVISISDRLADREQLDKIGGLAYLSELLDRVPTSAHVSHYANIVREKAIVRKLISVSTDIIKESYEEVEDVSNFLDSAERRIFEIRQGRSKNDMLPIAEVVMTAFQKVEELYTRKELVTGTTTGFEKFDKMTAGLQPSDLLILAGRPSMGKTSLALNMATNAALRGKCPVVVFSLEMSAEQLVMRMLCSEARVDASRLRTGHMEESDIPRLTSAATELSEADVYIDDNGDATILDLRAKCRRIHAKHGELGLVVIDYLQLMKGSSKAASREQEISEISRGLKALAKELNTPVLALSQLNRSLERRPDKRPIMSDLRESGAIEQDADVICFVYRDEVYNKETEEKGIAEVIIGKQRNGPIGTVRLRFFHPYTRFDNLYED